MDGRQHEGRLEGHLPAVTPPSLKRATLSTPTLLTPIPNTMKMQSLPALCLGLLPLAAISLTTVSAQTEEAKAPAVDAYAQSIIKRASEYLGEAKGAGFTAELWEDVLVENGPVLQSTRTVDVNLRRPDRLRAEIRSAGTARTLIYNGKSLTVHDALAGCFGTINTPATIDETLDAAAELGIEFPLEDVLLSKPFGDGASKAAAGQYLGVEEVLGKRCHHLAFQNETLDWQAWVDEGPLPVLRKAVLHFKKEPGKPSLTALFSNWKMGSSLPLSAYEFTPPPGTSKIEILAIREEAIKTPEAK